MKKRIAIITWIGQGNFGTSLQSFSLHWYLGQKGYDVCLVEASPFGKGLRHHVKVMLYLCGLLRLLNLLRNRKHTARQRKLDAFVAQYYNVPTLITSSQVSRFVNETDVFVSGSDQIWNSYYRYDPFMFLDFNTPGRKVAYASSMGTDHVKAEYQEPIRKALMDFDYIGVREQDAAKALSALTGRDDIVQVLDPTFLIKSEAWHDICRGAKIEFECPERYILCYLIGNNDYYQSQLEDVRRQTGIEQVVIIPSEETPDFSCPGAIRYEKAVPLEFVRLIENASLVCTDSFHATVLSINLQKDFVVLQRFQNDDPKSQNSRLCNVMERYGLSDRIYDCNTTTWAQGINYEPISQILEKDRAFSEKYLEKALQ